MSSVDHRFASPGVQGSSSISASIYLSVPITRGSHSLSEPIASQSLAPPSICALHTPTSSTCQVQAVAKTDVHAVVLTTFNPGPDAIEPSTHSCVVWAKALEIAKKKLTDNNLPPLDVTNLTSHSSEENSQIIVKALKTLQEDDKEKRWMYTWRGKEVIIVERLGMILRRVEKYTKIVGTVIQGNPQMSALVWAGIQAIMQVCI